jgi:uncharacterized protein YhaN
MSQNAIVDPEKTKQELQKLKSLVAEYSDIQAKKYELQKQVQDLESQQKTIQKSVGKLLQKDLKEYEGKTLSFNHENADYSALLMLEFASDEASINVSRLIKIDLDSIS